MTKFDIRYLKDFLETSLWNSSGGSPDIIVYEQDADAATYTLADNSDTWEKLTVDSIELLLRDVTKKDTRENWEQFCRNFQDLCQKRENKND